MIWGAGMLWKICPDPLSMSIDRGNCTYRNMHLYMGCTSVCCPILTNVSGFFFFFSLIEYVIVTIQPIEYRAIIMFLFLKGNTPQSILEEMTAVYETDFPSKSVIKDWYQHFKCGQFSVEIYSIPSCPRLN